MQASEETINIKHQMFVLHCSHHYFNVFHLKEEFEI